mmetsp:Transcript_8471/g.22298  ORF Transcript_8471/g.22298 Transcript_8471/m.22298 type:complete len:204 (+) Transcript_8471:780-1391(+)
MEVCVERVQETILFHQRHTGADVSADVTNSLHAAAMHAVDHNFQQTVHHDVRIAPNRRGKVCVVLQLQREMLPVRSLPHVACAEVARVLHRLGGTQHDHLVRQLVRQRELHLAQTLAQRRAALRAHNPRHIPPCPRHKLLQRVRPWRRMSPQHRASRRRRRKQLRDSRVREQHQLLHHPVALIRLLAAHIHRHHRFPPLPLLR